MALAVNLAHHPKTAPTLMMMEGEEVGASSSLKFLMRKVAKSRDPLMWKMMRGMAGCTGLDGRMAFLDYIDDIMHHLMKPGSSSSTLVEILGLLATLTIPDFDYAKLCAAYTLLPFLQSRLHSAVQIVAAALPNHPDGSDQGAAGAGLAEDDDVTLEVVALLGTMSADEGVAPMIAETQIVQTLMELMIGRRWSRFVRRGQDLLMRPNCPNIAAKEDDDEMILQIIYCGYQLLLHESTRAVLLDETEIVSYLIDLLYDRNVEIRRMCDVCLDLISETDEEYLTKIQHQKFHYHNSEWLHRIAQSSSTHDLNLSPDPYSLHHQHASHAAALRRDVDSDMYASYVRRGAIFDAKDEWSESGSDGEDGEEDFGKGMVVGGNNALLDGFD
ncbi:Kinesin-associated protein 3 [Thoreauomyces humboldtii]|nr:Kinesin-associated protein 3 [Thoreauomyces humboldtii]